MNISKDESGARVAILVFGVWLINAALIYASEIEGISIPMAMAMSAFLSIPLFVGVFQVEMLLLNGIFRLLTKLYKIVSRHNQTIPKPLMSA
ncbi:MAG: hypothetical protein LBQ52_03925 [Helicobacteraceae bacterium]|jgi:hypothetical protein|nr:hypothetical protein [Helicobacteraceae bacterium]